MQYTDLTTLSADEISDRLQSTPCGCSACNEGVQQGHFACEVPPDWALSMERAGEIVRHYGDSGWKWEQAA